MDDPRDLPPREASNIENVSEADAALWARMIDRVQEAMQEFFPDGNVMVVLGMQWGSMGQDPEQPVCLVTSNLPICGTPLAIHDMHEQMVLEHDEHHKRFESLNSEDFVSEPVPVDAVPADVREEAEEYARSMGLDPSSIVYMEYADVSDLNGAEGAEVLGE